MNIRFNEKRFVAKRDEYGKQLLLKKIADYDKQIAPTMRANGIIYLSEVSFDQASKEVLDTFSHSYSQIVLWVYKTSKFQYNITVRVFYTNLSFSF